MNAPTTPTAFLTTEDLGQRWHLEAYTVRKMCRTGRVPATFIGGQWLVKPADAEAFERAQMNVAPAAKRTRRPRPRARATG